jgi:hypothetical protein
MGKVTTERWGWLNVYDPTHRKVRDEWGTWAVVAGKMLETDFSAPPFAEARTGPVEMTVRVWVEGKGKDRVLGLAEYFGPHPSRSAR